MKPTLSLLFLCALLSTCLAGDSPTQQNNQKLSAEQAKDALLRFIRAHRTTFVGDPDPDKLAKIAATPLGDGRYSLGAFRLDVSNHSYFVAIGDQGPAPFFYSGTFTEHDGIWTATEPNVQHALRLPDKSK